MKFLVLIVLFQVLSGEINSCPIQPAHASDVTFSQLQKDNVPIIFFGKSGVGKTTMVKGLAATYPELFYIPIITCTRNPRPDDDVDLVEYISLDDFLRLHADNVFYLTMHEGDRYYGYRKSNILNDNRHPLFPCSPYGLEMARSLNGILVLIEGDADRGLLNRNNPDEMSKRLLMNEILSNEFYKNDVFLKQMDVIHLNEWNKENESIETLKNAILETDQNINS